METFKSDKIDGKAVFFKDNEYLLLWLYNILYYEAYFQISRKLSLFRFFYTRIKHLYTY